MTRIIGDRKKSALDEMEEVARERNKDVAEEERLEALQKAKEEAERKAKETTKAPSTLHEVHIIQQIVEFELEAPRKEGSNEKQLMAYDLSLNRLRKAGFQRHPSPAEVFTLLADNLEGMLKGKLKEVGKDMIFGFGEWLSLAFQRKVDTLVCYLHPEELYWVGSMYYTRTGGEDSLKYGEKYEFNIAGKKSGFEIPLEEFEDSFVKLFYGRSFKDLPKGMRQGGLKATVYLPSGSRIYPVGRGDLACYSMVTNFFGHNFRASRGVKEEMDAEDLEEKAQFLNEAVKNYFERGPK